MEMVTVSLSDTVFSSNSVWSAS